eukprot:1754049-Ditylum_brightwellii.AAC.1
MRSSIRAKYNLTLAVESIKAGIVITFVTTRTETLQVLSNSNTWLDASYASTLGAYTLLAGGSPYCHCLSKCEYILKSLEDQASVVF